MAISISENPTRSSTCQTYNVNFFRNNIFTTVTRNSDVVVNWIDNLKYIYQYPFQLVVGLDVEWRPPYSRTPNPVATLQLCVGDRCLIYQIIHSDYGIPQSLADFLSDEFYNNTFVGVGVKEDLEKLERDYGIGGSAHYVDLRGLAAEKYGMPELRNMSLKNLARFVLGTPVETPEGVRRSHWDQPRLTHAQVMYACVDAYLSFEIGVALGLTL